MAVSLIAGVAIGGLISSHAAPSAPPPSAPEGSPDAPVNGPVTMPSTEMDRRLPLWGFMALALTCAAGSMFVTEQLKNAEAKRLRRKPPVRQPMLTSNIAALPPATANPDLALAALPPQLMLPVPQTASHPDQLEQGISTSFGISPLPSATSLTTSQLDSLMAITGSLAVTTSQLTQPRLAELLDLRKKRSLDDLIVTQAAHLGLINSAQKPKVRP